MSDNEKRVKNMIPFPYVGLFDLDIVYQTSDVEILYKMIYKLNETIQALNDIKAELLAYFDERFQEVNDAFDDYKVDMNNRFNNLTEEQKKQLDAMHDQLEEWMDGLERQLLELEAELNRKFTAQSLLVDQELNRFNERIDFSLEQIYKKVISYIDSLTDSNWCINPTNGKYEPICKIIHDLYEWLSYGRLTALEFDTEGMTCAQYDSYAEDGRYKWCMFRHLTARMYDMYGRMWIYHPRDPYFLRNNITGLIEPTQKVVSMLFEFVNRATSYTAGSFDGGLHHAKNLDAMNLNALQLDTVGLYGLNGFIDETFKV